VYIAAPRFACLDSFSSTHATPWNGRSPARPRPAAVGAAGPQLRRCHRVIVPSGLHLWPAANPARSGDRTALCLAGSTVNAIRIRTSSRHGRGAVPCGAVRANGTAPGPSGCTARRGLRRRVRRYRHPVSRSARPRERTRSACLVVCSLAGGRVIPCRGQTLGAAGGAVWTQETKSSQNSSNETSSRSRSSTDMLPVSRRPPTSRAMWLKGSRSLPTTRARRVRERCGRRP
jgi:hypothetical protein